MRSCLCSANPLRRMYADAQTPSEALVLQLVQPLQPQLVTAIFEQLTDLVDKAGQQQQVIAACALGRVAALIEVAPKEVVGFPGVRVDAFEHAVGLAVEVDALEAAVAVNKVAGQTVPGGAHAAGGVSSTALRFRVMLVLVASTYGQMPLARSIRLSAVTWSSGPAMKAVRLSAMR